MVETLSTRGAVNNKVATFLDPSSRSLPSGLLLHYRYGAAVLTRFGTKTSQDAWKASDVWDRPDTEAVPCHTTTGSRAIIKKRDRARALALASNTMTLDDAMDMVAGLSYPQFLARQNKARLEKRQDILNWIDTSAQ
ncbi:hypothetical protein QCA50_017533 [Cerrena zonata]|uniref:Uncharacterized protein n=1 Tax=Cerrena zonata TaxID=2478898 RepID=A0AAW0FMN7_9APHY